MKLRCLLCLAVAAAALAQPPTVPKPATVEGKVVNSNANEPLRKVELTLVTTMGDDDDMAAALAMFGGGDDAPVPAPAHKIEKKSFQATTDASGAFRFEVVDPGDYYLSAKHAGFVDERYKPGSQEGSEGKIHLKAGDALSGIVLRMTPHGALSGHVLDEDGDPVANAIVMAMTYSYAMGHRKLIPVDTSTTNDRGEYRLGKLPPGHYYVSASALHVNPLGAAPPLPKDGAPETGYVSTYYPHTTDVAQATKLDVTPAADITGLTVQLQKSTVVRIKGQALTADGKPMTGGQVMLMSMGNIGAMQMGSLNPEGRFELANIQPGSYTLMTIQMGGGKPSMTMQPITVPKEGLTDLKLGAQPEKTIQGKVVTTGNGKVDLKAVRVMLAGEGAMPTMPVLGTVNETGAFTLKVTPSPYELTLTPIPPGTYLKSVMLNGHEMLGKALDFSSGGGDLVVTLGTDGGKVDGAVSLSGKPLFDATVVLLPADATRRFPETTKVESTDDAGHLVFKDVPPGDYLVFAWEKVESGAWYDPDFLKAAEKQAVPVTVDPKGNGKVEIKAIPRA